MATAIAVRDFDFKGHKVRCVGTDRDPWFVAKDVCEALGMVWKGTESLAALPEGWKGVRKLRTPMRQKGGALRVTLTEMVCINYPGLYKLVLRSNKPEADAFTNWVAEEVLPSIRRTGAYIGRRAEKYLAAGRTPEWVEERQEGIEARKGFTDTLKGHGVAGSGYATCTDAINRPVLGGSAALVKAQRGLGRKASLRDSLSTLELMQIKLAEALAANRIEADALQGTTPCAEACRLSGRAVAAAVQTVAHGALSPPAPALPPAGKDELPDTCFPIGPRRS